MVLLLKLILNANLVFTMEKDEPNHALHNYMLLKHGAE
jgi:hypothetical protein